MNNMLLKLEDICNKDLTISEIEKDIYKELLKMDCNLINDELKILTFLLVKNKPMSVQAIFGLFGSKKIERTIDLLDVLSELNYLNIRIVDGSTVFIDCNLQLDDELSNKVKESLFPLPTLQPIKPDASNCFTKGHDPKKRESYPMLPLHVLNDTGFILDTNSCREDEHNPKLFTREQLRLQTVHNNETRRVVDILSGRIFFFDWKYDHRGRMYPTGYHLNPHGTNHKKAMLELI